MLAKPIPWCSRLHSICSPLSLRSLSPILRPCHLQLHPSAQSRLASSASSTRWKTRQASDPFAREAKVHGLKSRAAFKLLQINEKYRIFKKGDTVVDLGYAPGSWSQVAASRTSPGGRVIGVDMLPAQPPRGVSTIQGNFLSPSVQAEVRAYVLDPERGRARGNTLFQSADDDIDEFDEDSGYESGAAAIEEPGYMDLTQRTSTQPDALEAAAVEAAALEARPVEQEQKSKAQREEALGRVVDVVLSDMCEPWDQTTGFGKKSISNAYRMMNTSGIPFRDHAGSMDLCTAALNFGFDTLRGGGHFVCKFYQGAEDKMFETKLKRMFEKVHRDKPSASRSESREGYFVALRRKEAPRREDVFAE